MSIMRTFILQFYLNTLYINKVGECYLPSTVRRQYFSIIFNEKKSALYLIKYWNKHVEIFVQYLKYNLERQVTTLAKARIVS